MYSSPVYSSSPSFIVSSKVVGGTGWNHLANSQWTNATNAFTQKIATGVEPGATRVGYALASAGAGDLDHAVWAMRRAFERNMGDIDAMMFEEELLPSVEAVTRMYETRMETSGENSDDAFMLAALYQMQGDPEMAAMAADYIEKANSLDVASVNLTTMIKQEMKSVPMAKGPGWKYLADGRSHEAISEFIKEITADTKAGAPKLGFALATAQLGDTKQAVWALRRAFEFDPEGVSDVVLDGELRPALQLITTKYEQEVEATGTNQNNSLLLATLYQLQGDIEGAEFMVSTEKMPEDMYVTSLIKEEMHMQEDMLAKAMPESKAPIDFMAMTKVDGYVELDQPKEMMEETAMAKVDDYVEPSLPGAMTKTDGYDQPEQSEAMLNTFGPELPDSFMKQDRPELPGVKAKVEEVKEAKEVMTKMDESNLVELALPIK